MIEILHIVILYIKRPLLSIRRHSKFLSISVSLKHNVLYINIYIYLLCRKAYSLVRLFRKRLGVRLSVSKH
ncbi:hypothetical protein RchiOBHm_Chr4g0400931 [Rosa chinensis]|uniref:Uncharacterized protein n=1 Tax=Rosa chinensis TaxID=74649 RepID=A0A2P6QSY8_ROSCH|nr:hypothetical protein RchiOBHm_Chr4g0400931 [Rosa chinensis]